MLQELLDYDPVGGQRRLTDWELRFIADVRSRIEAGTSTDSQRTKLEQIWRAMYG